MVLLWDGSNWTQRIPFPAPPVPSAHALAYDSLRGRTVLFGGANSFETWEYGPDFPATLSPFGSGCPGSAGTPVLTSTGRPWLGDQFTREVSNVPSGNFVILVIGLQTQTWNGLNLPLDLVVFGAPGCTMYVSAELAVLMATAGTSASLGFTIPNAPALLGLQFHDQALVFDPGVNALGGVVTNAATGTLGGR